MSTSRKLTDVPFVKLNQYLLALRYQDFLRESYEAKEVKLGISKAFLLGYGSTHAAHEHQRGLFKDIYHREAIQAKSTDLHGLMLSSVNIALRETKAYEDKALNLFRPINDFARLKQLLGDSFTKYFEDEAYQVEIAGKKISLARIKVDPSDVERSIINAEYQIGTLGQYPNRDTQLWIVANANEKDFIAEFINLYDGIAGDSDLKTDLAVVADLYNPSSSSSAVLKAAISRTLYTDKSHPDFTHHLGLIALLIETIKIPEELDETQQTKIQLAFSRLEFLINNALASEDEDRFSMLLEFAFDEIIFLNTFTQHKTQFEIEEILKKFIAKQFAVKSSPTFASLSNSGIDAISQNVVASIEEAKSAKDPVKIYFQRESYFEISQHLKTYIGDTTIKKDLPSEVAITLDKKPAWAEYKQDTICDVLVCDLVSSVSTEVTEHFEFDVETLIEKQFKLRAEIESKDKLIVVIDTTANKVDDDHIMLLLDRFQEEIQSGKLAIITNHSLNKYFHMGFDKMPGGLTAAFYNQKAFPNLTQFHQDNILINYHESDPTPQMIASFAGAEIVTNFQHQIKHESMDYIASHHRAIKQRSHQLHKKIIPDNLMTREDEPLFFVHKPSVNLFQTWGFMVFQFEKKAIRDDVPYAGPLLSKFKNFMDYLEIESRGGYGYFNTTLSEIPGNIFRLSLGSAENRDFLSNKLQLLTNFIMAINKAFDFYADNNYHQFLQVIEEIEGIYKQQFDELKKSGTAIKAEPLNFGRGDAYQFPPLAPRLLTNSEPATAWRTPPGTPQVMTPAAFDDTPRFTFDDEALRSPLAEYPSSPVAGLAAEFSDASEKSSESGSQFFPAEELSIDILSEVTSEEIVPLNSGKPFIIDALNSGNPLEVKSFFPDESISDLPLTVETEEEKFESAMIEGSPVAPEEIVPLNSGKPFMIDALNSGNPLEVKSFFPDESISDLPLTVETEEEKFESAMMEGSPVTPEEIVPLNSGKPFMIDALNSGNPLEVKSFFPDESISDLPLTVETEEEKSESAMMEGSPVAPEEIVPLNSGKPFMIDALNSGNPLEVKNFFPDESTSNLPLTVETEEEKLESAMTDGSPVAPEEIVPLNSGKPFMIDALNSGNPLEIKSFFPDESISNLPLTVEAEEEKLELEMTDDIPVAPHLTDHGTKLPSNTHDDELEVKVPHPPVEIEIEMTTFSKQVADRKIDLVSRRDKPELKELPTLAKNSSSFFARKEKIKEKEPNQPHLDPKSTKWQP